MRMIDLINCISGLVRAMYPIIKDLAHHIRQKKKASQSSSSDRPNPQG